MTLLLMPDDQLLAQCVVDRYRVQGAGGQKRNKTSSAVRIRHAATGIVVTASEERSQQVNQRRAVRRLREAIALYVRSAVNRGSYVPSQLLQSCLKPGGAFRISKRNENYFLVVSEVLDVLCTFDLRVREAAEAIGISTAQLVGFIEADAKLWERVNQLRLAAGQKPLR